MSKHNNQQCKLCSKELSPEENLLNEIFGTIPPLCSPCTGTDFEYGQPAITVNGQPLTEYLKSQN